MLKEEKKNVDVDDVDVDDVDDVDVDVDDVDVDDVDDPGDLAIPQLKHCIQLGRGKG